MSRYTGPKNRIARRFACNIFSNPKDPMQQKRNTPPGMHGAKRAKKKSDYGLQLDERQKLKAVYGMLTQKQFVNAYHKALTKPGDTAQHFAEALECRLDNLVYRLRWSTSIFGAGQLVSHGHICVNGKRVDIRSFVVKQGDVISLKDSSRQGKMGELIKYAQGHNPNEVPEYLALEDGNFAGKLVSVPHIDSLPHPILINIRLVCESLSHTT